MPARVQKPVYVKKHLPALLIVGALFAALLVHRYHSEITKIFKMASAAAAAATATGAGAATRTRTSTSADQKGLWWGLLVR